MKAILAALGKDKLIDLIILGVEVLRDADFIEDSDKDEIAFDLALTFLRTMKTTN